MSASDTVFRFDRLQSVAELAQDDHGDYTLPACVSKVGVFQYRNADGTNRNEYRPMEEVLKQTSLDSIALAPVTRGHPASMRIDSKSSHLRVGVVKPGLRPDYKQGKVEADLLIHSDEALDAIRDGEKAISPGYTCRIDATSGEWQGQRYDCIQRDIKTNHIALLPVGKNRQGPDVRVYFDSIGLADPGNSAMVQIVDGADAPEKENIMADTVKVRVLHIDGADHEVPVAIADAYSKEIAKLQASKDAETARADGLDRALKDAQDTNKLNAKINARVALLTSVERLTNDKADVAATDRDLQAKVIAKFDGKLSLEGKSDEYVSALFDVACSQLTSQRADGVGVLGAALNPRGGYVPPVDDEVAARQRMLERNFNMARTAK